MKTRAAFKKIISKDFAAKLGKDDIFEMSASLAYYSALSLAPLLILLFTFIALIHESFREEMLSQIQNLIGSKSSDLIRDIAKNVDKQPEIRNWAGIIGLVTLLFSAGAIFGELRASLNRIFEVDLTAIEPKDQSIYRDIWDFMKMKIFNMGMVLTFVFISIISLMVSSLLSLFLKGNEAIIGQLLNFAVSLLIFTILFTAIYFFLPQRKVRGLVALTSGFITAVFFSIGKSLIGLYLGQSAVASLYGAAGSFIVVLMWVYYSSAVIFLSAEIANAVNKERIRGENMERPATGK